MISTAQPQYSPRGRSTSKFSRSSKPLQPQPSRTSSGPIFTITSDDSTTSSELSLEGLNGLSSFPPRNRMSRSSNQSTFSNSSLFVPSTDGRGRIIPKGSFTATSDFNSSSSSNPTPKRAETRSLPLNARKSTSASTFRSMTLKMAQNHFVNLSKEHQVQVQGQGSTALIQEEGQSAVIDSSDEEDSSDEQEIEAPTSTAMKNFYSSSHPLRRMPSTLYNLSRDFSLNQKFPDAPKRRHSRGGYSSLNISTLNHAQPTTRRAFARTWSGETIPFADDEDEEIKSQQEKGTKFGMKPTSRFSSESSSSSSEEETSFSSTEDLDLDESSEEGSVEDLENIDLSDEDEEEEFNQVLQSEIYQNLTPEKVTFHSLEKLSTSSSESLTSTSTLDSISTNQTSIQDSEEELKPEEDDHKRYDSDSDNSLYRGFTNSIFSSSEEEFESDEEDSTFQSQPSKPFYGACPSYDYRSTHHLNRQQLKAYNSRSSPSNRFSSAPFESDSEDSDDWEFGHSIREEEDDDEEFETIILGIGNINDEVSQPLQETAVKPNPRPTSIAEMQRKVNLPVIVAPKNVVDKLLARRTSA